MSRGSRAEGGTTDPGSESRGILSDSAVMAAGTVVSRASGFVRSALLAAALGAYLHADLFNIANTIPNMLYILLAGGVFNAVLVPQLVRAMKNDSDGGEAYTNRIITLAGLFLAGVTAVLVITAPWLMRVFLSDDFFEPELATQRESVIAFARFCLPQVFFYGMFVLVGQVLNARRRFGPMMWAPIANNVISVVVLVIYLFVFGPASGDEVFGGYSANQEMLLGLGSTLGIAVQLLVLLPYLKAAGFSYRPRFDFRGSGLGHTLRLGMWTVMFVIVNQIAYTVVVRLASGGAAAGLAGDDPGTGYTIYSQTFLLVMVPHSIATVSLATAVLPRLSVYAADHDLTGVARGVSSTLRSTLTLIIPFALLLPLIAYDLANIVYGWLAAADAFPDYAPPLSLFAIGLVFFTVHYLMLRGFYSLERTRTVFWIQCAVAATNIALAIAVTSVVSAGGTASGLVLAYVGSYAVGAVISYWLLRRLLGGLQTPALVRFLVRLLIAAGVATAVTWAGQYAAQQVWPVDDSKLQAIVMMLAVTGLDVVLFLTLARAMRITEVTSIMDLATSRLRRSVTP
ncbi:MAG TPA: murein biosynthesis integral membrane protein MurJ [Nocardioidaceae bacterium]|nr:murein biosynthesis integral membrane protein MurJ [Nocardioidaceae bacterium]